LTVQHIHQKKPRLRDRTDRAWFSRLFTTSAQEMERVYSYNPGIHAGPVVLCVICMSVSLLLMRSMLLYTRSLSLSLSLSILTAIFPGERGLASFTGAKDDGGGGNNWSYKMCKAPVRSSPPTNRHPTFFTGRMPFL